LLLFAYFNKFNIEILNLLYKNIIVNNRKNKSISSVQNNSTYNFIKQIPSAFKKEYERIINA